MTAVPAPPAVTVLLVEDNPADTDLIREALDEAFLSPTLDVPALGLEHVPTLAKGLERLAAGSVDVVLLDLSLPDSQGLETFIRLQRAVPTVPIIVLSGLQDEERAVRAVREGAQDYLVKGQVDGVVLSRAIRYAIERKHAEDERARLTRERAEADAALRARDETLATVSHDLRTPLTSIRMSVQLLQRRLAQGANIRPGDLAAGLARIEEQTTQMARMLDDLLDVARLETGRPLDLHREPCDLLALVRKAAADVQRTAERHTVRVHAEAPELVGELDCARLERVLQNLLSNAVKYSPNGGFVDVSLRREEAGDQAWAVLAIRDYGVGIPPEDLPRVFERFYRASNVSQRIGGTGLGLAGARQIVEQHGGEIAVDSQPNAGSTFTVRLPL